MPRFNLLWVTLGLLLAVSRTWAQSNPATSFSDTQSIEALKTQAENGNGTAEFSLGTAYRDGFGVPQDFAESYFWLDLAASHITNDPDLDRNVRKVRDEVASHLTNTVLLESQERAKEWFASHQPGAPAFDARSSNGAQADRQPGGCSPAGSDDPSRVAFYTCKCNESNMDACANLGTYYRMG